MWWQSKLASRKSFWHSPNSFVHLPQHSIWPVLLLVFPFHVIVFIYNMSSDFVTKAWAKWQGEGGNLTGVCVCVCVYMYVCETFRSDDVMQFTGCSCLSLLYFLWLQTSPRSSCFCYYQHDWVTQQLPFPIWTLGSTHRSIATHLLPHSSCLSVRRKIGVPTVTRRIFEKTTFNQQPTPLHHNYYYY